MSGLADELEALAKAATPGPWQRNGSHIYGDDPNRHLCAQFIGGYGDLVETADLVVALRNALPEIIAALRQTDPDAAHKDARAVMNPQSGCVSSINTGQVYNDALALQADEWEGKYAIVSEMNHHMKAKVADLVEGLKSLEPFLDAIVCYASTMDEYEPNRIAQNARALIERMKP